MMKRIPLLAICMIISLAVTSQASQETITLNKSNILKTGFFAPLFSTISVAYERALNENTSVQGQLLLNWEIPATAVIFDYKVYLSDTPAPKGIFVSPFIGAGSSEGPLVGTGLTIGIQNVFKEIITLEAFLGPVIFFGGGAEGVMVFVRPGITVGIVL